MVRLPPLVEIFDIIFGEEVRVRGRWPDIHLIWRFRTTVAHTPFPPRPPLLRASASENASFEIRVQLTACQRYVAQQQVLSLPLNGARCRRRGLQMHPGRTSSWKGSSKLELFSGFI